ncbi:MAG TPA: glycosyltransferase [Chitinophagaceae bacterium]|nr:glycosyltransferase [Chitinophagaceae bacterium]
MISIITAVHDGLPVNRIFQENLARFTRNPFELIIIDNASRDGSGAFFAAAGARVITNDRNFSYPHSQNQGIDAARFDLLCFLNNDTVVSPGWDERLIASMTHHGLDLVSACGVEHLETEAATRSYSRKWKRVKNLLSVLGTGTAGLKSMHRMMYGDWETFCENRYQEHRLEVIEGIVGNNVMVTRRGIRMLGPWDERIQGADFDLFMRAKKRSVEKGDIRACHIALDVFIHHYIRLTVNRVGRKPAFADADRMIPLEEKWSDSERMLLHPDRASRVLQQQLNHQSHE